MSMEDSAAALGFALSLADAADRIARLRFGAPDLVVDVKPNGSPVCDADRAIESEVVSRIRAAFPALPVFGRERGPAFDGSSTYWAIDPIDGSSSFIAGRPAWGFLASLVRDGIPSVGVASSVGLGRRWWAAAGLGAFARTLPEGQVTRLQVSAREDLASAAIGWWDGWRTTTPGRVSAIEPIVGRLRASAASVTPNGGAALAVASGELDAAVMRSPNDEPHHLTAFVVLVREAGGMATPLLAANTILFSNRRLHDHVRAVLADS